MLNKMKIVKILGYILFSLLLLYSYSLWGMLIGSLFFLVTLISFIIYFGFSVIRLKNRKLKYSIISILVFIITLFLTIIFYPPKEIRLASSAYLHLDTLEILSDTSVYINRSRFAIDPARGIYKYYEFSFVSLRDKDGIKYGKSNNSGKSISHLGFIDYKDELIQLKQGFERNNNDKPFIYLKPTKDGLLDIKSDRLFFPYKGDKKLENDTNKIILKKKLYHSTWRSRR